MRLSRAALAATVLAGSTALAFTVSTGSASAGSQALGLSALGDVVADGVHERLFLSDPTAGAIVATGYTGEEVARRADLPGVRGLALSTDSNTLYAAVDGAAAIVAFATDTLAETARYPLGENVFPEDVTVAGDRLWFGYDKGATANTGNIGSVDAEGNVRLYEPSADESFYTGPPNVFSNSSVLVVKPDRPAGSVPNNIRTLDVSTGIPLALLRESGHRLEVADVAFTADGTSAFRVGGMGLSRVRLADGKVTVVSPRPYEEHIDIAADGRLVTAAGYAVSVYDPSGQAFQWSESLAHSLSGGGLVWQPGAERVLAVTRGYESGRNKYYLETVTRPAPTSPTPEPSMVTIPGDAAITVTVPTSVVNGRPVTLSGTAKSLPVGHTLRVTRREEWDTGSEPPVIGSPVIDSFGAYTFTDTPPKLGIWIYTVSYGGSLAKTARVALTQFTPALTLDKHGTTHAHNATATVTATLGKTYSNRVVEIWAEDPYTRWLLKRATVNSAGKVSASLRLQYNTTITATFTGDREYAARSVRSRLYTKVSVLLGIRNHYRTKKIGAVKYYHFRTTKDPHFNVTMTRHAGRWQRTVIQRHTGGKWKNYLAGYFPLDRYGHSYVRFAGTYKAGTKWRVRSEYIWSGSGDNLNASTYGAWTYFTYTK
ncbi:hypothetical protein AB0G04_17860 [Actinoplanes sp. NPDC023801]|uniref:YncE family protein n=1 Tax=Actinoplanes sp. NPDC023801 TaxID=3154595 RepID=UPI0033F51227